MYHLRAKKRINSGDKNYCGKPFPSRGKSEGVFALLCVPKREASSSVKVGMCMYVYMYLCVCVSVRPSQTI